MYTFLFKSIFSYLILTEKAANIMTIITFNDVFLANNRQLFLVYKINLLYNVI